VKGSGSWRHSQCMRILRWIRSPRDHGGAPVGAACGSGFIRCFSTCGFPWAKRALFHVAPHFGQVSFLSSGFRTYLICDIMKMAINIRSRTMSQ